MCWHILTVFFFFLCVQLDLKGLPPLIANRVLKRYPLSVHYLRQHLMQRHARQNPPRTLSTPRSLFRRNSLGLSGRHYEEPLPVKLFTGKQPQLRDADISSDKLTSISEEREDVQQQQISASMESRNQPDDDRQPVAHVTVEQTVQKPV